MLFRNIEDYLRSGFQPRVCIIGTGPAGMSIALRLEDRKVPCLLVEAGGFEFSPASQDFYRGEVVGDQYHKLHEARLRQFGGSSGHWSGWVCPLDASDFEARAYMPYSGWPIGLSDLEPYSAAADQLLKVKPHLNDRPMTPDINYIHYRYSPPVRFGTDYRAHVEQSGAIGLLLNSPVLELVPGKDRIAEIRIGDGTQGGHSLPVDQVCLCTGGIENSRILLWSNARHQGRVVSRAETLGRYWMEHIDHALADVFTFENYEARFEVPVQERWLFGPSERAKKTYAIGGAHIWMRGHEDDPNRVKELFHEVMCIAPDLSNRFLKRLGKEYHCGGSIHAEFEQVPIPENRIELDTRTDALGVPCSRLHWKKSEFERRTAFTMTRLFGEALIKQNIGRLRMRNYLTDGTAWPLGDQGAGYHHMGGTRMADSPATGVVDKNCKVFGMDNLYVGGSSVFTTGGHASPTYNIVRLALRLGDHLAGKVARA